MTRRRTAAGSHVAFIESRMSPFCAPHNTSWSQRFHRGRNRRNHQATVPLCSRPIGPRTRRTTALACCSRSCRCWSAAPVRTSAHNHHTIRNDYLHTRQDKRTYHERERPARGILRPGDRVAHAFFVEGVLQTLRSQRWIQRRLSLTGRRVL